MKPALIGAAAAVLLVSQASWSIAQDQPAGAPVVSALTVRAFEEAPVPEIGVGAPLFTAGEIGAIQEQARKTMTEATTAVRQCAKGGLSYVRPVTIKGMLAEAYRAERDAAQLVQTRSIRARRATEQAQQARRDAAAGAANAEALAATELSRQAAVNALVAARNDLSDASAAIPVMQQLVGQLDRQVGPDRIGWERTSVDKVLPLVEMFKQGRAVDRIKKTRSVFADLIIRDVVVREGDDNKGGFLAVSGKVVNTRPRAIRLPSLEITQVDGMGFPLESVIADPGRKTIASGAAAPFTYQFRPRAARAQSVAVTFASTEAPPQRRSPSAAIAPPPPPGSVSGSQRGMLAGDMGARVGVAPDGPADCSG